MRNLRLNRLLLVVLIQFLVLPSTLGQAIPSAQGVSNQTRAEDLLTTLTPEERVGQLFLVTFPGSRVDQEAEIYSLISEYHIGGVVLLAENDNFTSADTTVNDAWVLINQLQTTRFSSSQEELTNPETGETYSPTYIPLFISTSQEGDGYPNDQILNGLSPLPSQLAIGATWNPELAQQVGSVLGDELAALGINLLLGPSLDVVETPKAEATSDLGVRVFGGDPYWVGEMGRAYITGVHQGSEGRIAVVGTHFPGLGSSDRLPIDEVATVRKSLEQLKQIELAPFFAVTGNAGSPEATVDALLTSHIRYQGLQGNIRSTTRPVSFDQNALNLLMELPALNAWREGGGVMISDNLGSRAVRRFYDPTEEGFNLLRPARDALLAGNDLLYVGNILDSDDPEAFETVVQTIEFFAQKYREDPAFAQRVDDAVLRILTLKFDLYGFFTLNLVLPAGDDIHNINQTQDVTFDVAHQSATLISPSIEELDPVSPELNDRILFFTDTYLVQQCTECPQQPVLPVNSLEETIINLYGPDADGQIARFNLVSHTFAELELLLDGLEGGGDIESDVRRADWIVFTLLDVSSNRPTSTAVRKFLTERPDLTRQKKVIAFSANAPYYLDATDISNLTAYYGLYSKSNPFIDIAARLLFKEITAPLGSLPVSVPGVGYDLISETSPDPERTIPILLDLPELEVSEDTAPPEALPLPTYKVGDIVPLRTGIILDHNGHPIPNNTPVQFILSIEGEDILIASVTTLDGIARTNFTAEQSGRLEIHAISGSATSDILEIEVMPLDEEEAPTPTLTATAAATPTNAPTATIMVPTPVPTPEPVVPQPETGLIDWVFALLVASVVGWSASRTGALMSQVRWGMRWGLTAFIAGMLVYSYLAAGFPGSMEQQELTGRWGMFLFTFLGAGLGWGIAMIVKTIQNLFNKSN